MTKKIIISRLDLNYLKDDNFVLLNYSCFPLPSDNHNYSEGDLEFLEAPWKTKNEKIKCYEEINLIYEYWLICLSEKLNILHNTNYSLHFWRILLGPWLHKLVCSAYEKYTRLNNARNLKYDTIFYCKKSKNKPSFDTASFVEKISYCDAFNSSITFKIASFMNFKTIFFENFQDESKTIIKKRLKIKENIKRYLKYIYILFLRIFILNSKSIIIINSYFCRSLLKKLFFHSKGKIINLPTIDNCYLFENFDSDLRKKLKSTMLQIRHSLEINNILCELIIDEIPIVFLEYFSNLLKQVKLIFGKSNPSKIISATDWYYNEKFKLWASINAENGSKLISLQHGGNYFILKNMYQVDHELKISDCFLTWGYKNKKLKNTLPLFNQKIHNIYPKFTKNKKSTNIVYTLSAWRRFLIDGLFYPDDFKKYHQNQIDFITHTRKDLRKALKIRLHHDDLKNWNIGERLKRKFPDLIFDNTINFSESLSNCTLFICDHLCTTYLESLCMNIPTILFFDPDLFIMHKSIIPFFDQLKTVKILHCSGAEAASFLNENINNIENWWFSSDCQDARSRFCEQFSKNSNSPKLDFLTTIKSIFI